MLDTTEVSLSDRFKLDFTYSLDHNKNTKMRFYWKHYVDQIHGTVPLISMHDGLKEVFNWFVLLHPHKYNDFETPLEDLVQMIKSREKRMSENFNYKVPPFEASLLDMLGNMSMDMGKNDKAKVLFELNIEYYPENPIVYLSMAEYFLSQKNISEVNKYIDKASEMDKENEYEDRVKSLLERSKN